MSARMLRDDEVIELGEMLEFVHDWLGYAHDTFADTLTGFAGGGYTLDELRADLARFVFLLGGPGDRLVFGDPR